MKTITEYLINNHVNKVKTRFSCNRKKFANMTLHEICIYPKKYDYFSHDEKQRYSAITGYLVRLYGVNNTISKDDVKQWIKDVYNEFISIPFTDKTMENTVDTIKGDFGTIIEESEYIKQVDKIENKNLWMFPHNCWPSIFNSFVIHVMNDDYENNN